MGAQDSLIDYRQRGLAVGVEGSERLRVGSEVVEPTGEESVDGSDRAEWSTGHSMRVGVGHAIDLVAPERTLRRIDFERIQQTLVRDFVIGQDVSVRDQNRGSAIDNNA